MIDALQSSHLPPPPTRPPESDHSTPWALSTEETVRALRSDPTRGLSTEEAAARLRTYGPNSIPEPEPDPLWKRYWGQLTGDAVVRLLMIGGVVSLLLGDLLEGFAIVIMLNIMAGFGLWQEGRATDAARSLRRLDVDKKYVIRNGQRVEVTSDEIVPGDLVYLPTGAIAPADGRIITAVNAQKDTSTLTGESLPVGVDLEPLPTSTVVNSQKNMIHRGNAVVSGNLTYIVTATGSQTELGKIAQTLAETEESQTPLDEQLDQLGDVMARIFTWLSVIVIGTGVFLQFYRLTNGFDENATIRWGELVDSLREAFINAVALIIAAIPEGLPAVLTITLAIATSLMVRKNALIRRMKAVEGGGSMTILLSDKTGTLTANQMEVTHVYVNGRLYDVATEMGEVNTEDRAVRRALAIAKLCNNSSDPTENALLRWVEQTGFESFGDVSSTNRAREHEFDQSLKRMTAIYPGMEDGFYHIMTKGAPEQVIRLCHNIHLNGEDLPFTEERKLEVLEVIRELASRGLRVIALADRDVAEGHTLDRSQAENELTFVGIMGIMDPPRVDVASAVETLRTAGIRTVMVTGDNPLTAYYISKQVGIVEGDIPFDKAVISGEELTENLPNPSPEFLQHLHTVRVFARVTPQHKAQIVDAMQQEGFIVGMTGDGVNDAIALKESDVGFAMGNGTDVAREASDIVLMDSRFSTIPVAVEEGRNVIHRIRLYLSYILSGNGCEVGAFILAYLMGLPIPLTALALLVINFATDSFPALAMAFEPGEEDAMRRPPRKRDAAFITQVMWIHIGVQTLIATIIIMGVYYFALEVLGTSLAEARAAAFMTYIWQKLYRAFTARSMILNVWEIGFFENRWTLAAVALSFSIAMFFVYMPYVNTAVEMAPLSIGLFLLAAIVGLIPPAAEELTKIYLIGPKAPIQLVKAST